MQSKNGINAENVVWKVSILTEVKMIAELILKQLSFTVQSGCEYTDTNFSSGLYYEPLRVGDIHWNFEKFLIDKNGKPYTRYHPSVTTTDALTNDINTLLSA